MNSKAKKFLILFLSILLCIVFGYILNTYTLPMKDIALDLSLTLPDGAEPEDFDDKGWTVFTQEGEQITELEPDGFGGYTGLELGQTFYFSRILKEELADPTLQLGSLNRNFSVFLDGKLIYTDCPDLDNRIGYLNLPMNDWERTEPTTITLPSWYQGKTLTIAQSFPEYTEAASVKAYPCSVQLYCGYSYESALIAESFQTGFLCMILFLVGLLLVLSFIRSGDVFMLCIAMVAFLTMTQRLTNTSFFFTYFGNTLYRYTNLTNLFIAGSLLLGLSIKSGKGRKVMLVWSAVYGLTVILSVYVTLKYETLETAFAFYFTNYVQEWIASIVFFAILILAAVYWRKENTFYRFFTPLAFSTEIIYWLYLLITDKRLGQNLYLSLTNRQITYIYSRMLYTLLFAALIIAAAEGIRAELNRRMEQQLLRQQKDLAVASYDNFRRQHEEVMMLRHDMLRHFHTLQEMSKETSIKDYLSDLIGKNEKIRPVIQSGNEVLDILLNGKLGAAIDAGIEVKITKADAPKKLPIRDADLCSLVMNILDNAIHAALETPEPFLHLKLHKADHFFAIVCENSADMTPQKTSAQKETVPKHGLGLKIIHSIVKQYEGSIDIDYDDMQYRLRVILPLD